MPAFGAQELSNLVWALAVLGLRPAAAWFKDFEVQVCVPLVNVVQIMLLVSHLGLSAGRS